MRRASILLTLALGTCLSQPPAGPSLTYEAASVKPNNSGSGNSSSHSTKGQVVFTNVDLKSLIERAYDVKPFQITGPPWMSDVHFDITAKFPPDTGSKDHPLLLRALLEERFQLAVHRTSKETQGYAMEVLKSGFKLQPVDDAGGPSTGTNSNGKAWTLTVKHISMQNLADAISRILHEQVADRTAIPGVFNFELKWSDDLQKADGADSESGPSLFTSLQQTLGLRLKPQKIPVDIIVVDRVSRVPTEN
jgi:uncharacterized protein (TIGR03435 family)